MKTIIVAGAAALLVALLGTPLLIRLMRRHGYGQPIRVEGLKSQETKRGTPTMGGAVFVIAALIGYVVAHAATDDPLTPSGVLVLLMMTGLALVGFIDDFLKIFRQTSLGLRSRAKLAGQVVDHGPFKGLSSYAETNELVVKLAADLGRQVAARASEAAPCESRCLHHQNGAPRCRYPAMGPPW